MTEIGLYMRGLGVTQKQLAQHLGMSEWMMNHKIAGDYEFSVRDMWNIADYLGMSEQEMLRCFPRGGVAKAKKRYSKREVVYGGRVCDKFFNDV